MRAEGEQSKMSKKKQSVTAKVAKLSPAEQKTAFEAAAAEAEVDTDEGRFKARLRKIAKAESNTSKG